MRTSFFLLLALFVGTGFCLTLSKVEAATLTVCASGCDYTTANAALAVATEGDIVNVQGEAASPYSSATEVWPISFPNASSTLTCTGGATLSQVAPASSNFIQLSTSSTVIGCTFGNVTLRTVSVGTEAVGGVRVVNNVFSSTVTSSVEFVYGARNFEISGNTNINFLALRATSTLGLIENNTFYGRMGGLDSAGIFITSPSSSQLRVLSNTFTSYLTATGLTAMRAITLNGFNQTFATNTIKYAVTSPSAIDTSLLLNASGTNYIAGNFIDAPSEAGSCYGVSISQPSNNPWTSVYTLAHNTIRLTGNCWNGRGIYLSDPGFAATPSSTIDVSYNLIFNGATTTNSQFGIEVQRSSAGIPFTQTNTYNGAYRMGGVVRYATTGGSTTDVSAATSRTSNPFLKVSDASSANDLQTADFSAYLDVNGSQDIGATSASRRTSIYMDDTGIVDYAGSLGVDATTTADIADFLRTGDSVYLAAGTYRAFNINSSNATSSIAIQGVGASTIIDARANEDGITFTSVSSSILSSLVVRNASSTASTYTATRMNFAYGGNNYNDSAAPFSIPGNSTLYFTDVGSCILGNYTADGTDITSVLGTGNIHVGLVDLGGIRLTILTPNSVAANSSALQDILDTNCGGLGTVDRFISSVFTKSSNVYTYQASAVSGASATLVSGVTSPPTITLNTAVYAGIKLAGTSNNLTISGVTSTNNGYGISFATTNNGYNTVTSSTFLLNTQYDIASASSATNTFDNVSFNRTSSTVSGAGPILVKFRVRAQTVNAANATALSGVAVTATDGASQANDLGVSDTSGYTSFVSMPAYKITSGSSALTNGGYNPYTISTSLSGYDASSTQATISSIDTTVAMALSATATPTSSGGGSSSSGSSGGGAATAGSSSGGGGSAALFTFGNTPTTPISSPTPPAASPNAQLPNLIPAPNALLASPSAPIRTFVQNDATAFGVGLQEINRERLGAFIEFGTSNITQRLGSGERRAMVRDMLDTLRTDAISLSDLERLANGQIPIARNLAQERVQLPRVRQTFRSIFGHDPNFQNSTENLAWNTLMYRIRFVRDLSAEREGIQEFRSLFNRTPQDPFQWAVVRVLGYIE